MTVSFQSALCVFVPSLFKMTFLWLKKKKKVWFVFQLFIFIKVAKCLQTTS